MASSQFIRLNPGIGGLDELTSAEEDLINEFVLIAHANGTLIRSNGTSWVGFTSGASGQQLRTTAAGALEWFTASAGTGDVTGPGSSTANAVTRFSGTGGKTIQNSNIILDTSNMYPEINDNGALGGATSAWSDLFLASGAVINFNNGDVTLTHSTNKIDIDGGVIDFGSTPTVADAAIYFSGGTDVAIVDGGTGASTSATARTNLGLVIGTNIQAWDNDLDDLAALSHSTSAFVVSNGTDWLSRTPIQARGDMGVSIGLNVQAWDTQLDDLAGLAVTDSNFIVGNGSNWVAETGATARTSIGLGTADTPQFARLGLGTAADSTAELNLAASGNIVVAGSKARRTIVLSAAGGDGASTSACADPATSATGGINWWGMAYDPSLEEVGYWNVVMPDSYDGSTLTAQFYWTTTAASGDVVWAISGRAYGNNEEIGQATGTQVEFNDTALNATDVHITGQSSAITLSGTPAGGEFVSFRVHRKAAQAADTLATDAHLMMVKIEFATSSYSD